MPSSYQIGALRATLGLDSAAFVRGADVAERRAKGLAGSLKKHLVSDIKGIAAGFAGAFAVDTLVRLAKDGLELASSLGEVSQQLGVSTKDLQEYRYAATQTGIAQDEMDAGLAKLTRTLGAAAGGAKTQSSAFRTLGIDIRDANGQIKSAGDVIPEIAEALAKIPDPAQRAAVLVDLFGKSGQKLAPLLAGGAAGVNSLREAAQKLGIVLSDDDINKADEIADKLTTLKTVMEAKIAGAVVANIGLIDAFSNEIIEFSKEIDNALKNYRAFVDFIKSSPAKRLETEKRIIRENVGNPFGVFDAKPLPRAGRGLGRKLPSPAQRLPVPVPVKPKYTGLPDGISFFVAPDQVKREFDTLVTEIRAGGISAFETAEQSFAEVSKIIIKPFAKARGGSVKEMQKLREELKEETARILDGLFPDEARVAEIERALATLDQALADQLIDPERWLAARGRLLIEMDALKKDIEDQIDLIDSAENERRFEDFAEKVRLQVEEVLGGSVKKTTADVARDFESMARNVLGSIDTLGRSIKDGDFVGILLGILDVLASIGEATGGFGIGPLKFPGRGQSDSSIPGFATGGSFRVGGVPGIDKNLISMRLTKGEMVDIRRPGDALRGGGVQLFDLSNAVVTADLLADINSRIADGTAQAVRGGAALAMKNMGRARQRSLI